MKPDVLEQTAKIENDRKKMVEDEKLKLIEAENNRKTGVFITNPDQTQHELTTGETIAMIQNLQKEIDSLKTATTEPNGAGTGIYYSPPGTQEQIEMNKDQVINFIQKLQDENMALKKEINEMKEEMISLMTKRIENRGTNSLIEKLKSEPEIQA
jgi:hypothetical protein